MTSPNPVVDIAAALLNCLCVEVAVLTTPPQHCRYGLAEEQPEDLGPANNLCCEGLAYVSALDTWWSVESFPESDIVRQIVGSCPPPAWAQKFKVGVISCVPVIDSQGTPPTDAEITAAALADMEVSWALRRVACCFRAWMDSQTGVLNGMSVYVDRQTVTTPQGGCFERSMMVTAQFP